MSLQPELFLQESKLKARLATFVVLFCRTPLHLHHNMALAHVCVESVGLGCY